MGGAGKGVIGPPASHIIETEIHGDISLYDPEREHVLVLNGTASDVWRLCDGEHSIDDIVALLASAYGAQAGEISDDVRRTIDQFIDEGFLPAS